MYRALYRKWRPQRFADVVGQAPIVTALQNQIAAGRIGHAYLFTGTRGTGKTTCAKIFAKAVNCLDHSSPDPCCQCEVCKGIDSGAIMDIIEMDAASNNGVDDIRDLRDEVAYLPSVCRYKVYIIDEVHMLSTQAFNALLKTMEEPPEHLMFILATTELQKVPATILSRCQRFDFGRIPAHQITERLHVALEEGQIQAEDAALARIARAAEGGMRDAWSIMDMCLSYAQEEDGGLTEELVLRVLGAADKSFLFAFADKLIDSDAAGALALIDEMMRKGREVQVFVRDVSAHLRALMLADICDEVQLSSLLEVTHEDAAEYIAQAGRTSHTRLMRMLDLFLASETDMKWAAQPRFALETAALRACAPEESLQVEALVARVDELERKLLGSELDMALVSGEAENEKLEYQLIASDEVVLLAGRKTRLAQRIPSGSTISLNACEGEKFILPTESLPFTRSYDELLARAGLSPFVVLRTDDSQCAKRVCAACSLVMLCPFITLLSDTPAMQQLSHYRLSDSLYTSLYMACPKDMPLTPYAQTLYTMMSNRFRAMTAYRL